MVNFTSFIVFRISTLYGINLVVSSYFVEFYFLLKFCLHSIYSEHKVYSFAKLPINLLIVTFNAFINIRDPKLYRKIMHNSTCTGLDLERH